MKKIVIVNQSVNYLTIDIVNEFAKRYDQTILIYGKLKISSKDINSSVNKKKIIAYNKKSILSRIFTWTIATIQICFLLIKYRKYEILFFTNPPLSYLPASFLKLNFSIMVFDIYPDNLKNFGIRENHFIYKWWMKLNKKIFSRSKIIFTLGEGMRSKLAQYVSKEKIKVVPLWSDINHFTPIPKEQNVFLKKYTIENKFIVMYSGNLGFTHSVEIIIELAKKLSCYPDILFIIIGNGGKKTALQKTVYDYQLNNCLFLDWQPADMLPYSLSCADIGIVTVNENTSMLSVPSKTFNLMAAGTPLLCIASPKSELNFLIEKYDNGRCYSKNQLNEMTEFVLVLKNNPMQRERMRQNSLSAAKNHTPQNAELLYKHLNK
ncbi:glycosyltransferase family 4 protein [Bacteroidales bacterium OttesenSCG-928-C19]|nr:glycosyltransferase family 4 protein [Bacteroidales bacterium OttesenSCG-928-C19]